MAYSKEHVQREEHDDRNQDRYNDDTCPLNAWGAENLWRNLLALQRGDPEHDQRDCENCRDGAGLHYLANVKALAIRYRRRQFDEGVKGSKIIKLNYSAVADCPAASCCALVSATTPSFTRALSNFFNSFSGSRR